MGEKDDVRSFIDTLVGGWMVVLVVLSSTLWKHISFWSSKYDCCSDVDNRRSRKKQNEAACAWTTVLGPLVGLVEMADQASDD